MSEEGWEVAFEKALRSGDVLGAADILRKTGKEGWIRRAEREEAARVVALVAPAPIVRRDWALRLLAHPRRVDKELAVEILIPLAGSHPRDVERAIARLEEERDRAVRRAAERLSKALAAAKTAP